METLLCALLSPALFRLAAYLDRVVDAWARGSSGPAPVMTVSSLTAMLAAVALILAVLGAAWPVVRIRDARIASWKKTKKKWL